MSINRQSEEAFGVDAGGADLDPEVEMGAGRPSRRSEGPQGLPADHTLADLDARFVEVKIERVETEAVVHDDEAAREKVLGHQRDAPVVDGDHWSASGSRVVGPAVGSARLAVD